MKRLKNLIIPILCVFALLIFAVVPLRGANAKALNQTVESLNMDGRINQEEINILNELINNIDFAGAGTNESREEEKTDYESFLIQYLGLNDVNLSTKVREQVEAKLKERNNVMKLENKNNMKELSTDGKEIAVGLTKDIFSICGLSAGFNQAGELISLSDKSGSLILMNGNTYKQHINAGVLLLVIAIVGILQVVCYILSRKSRIMIKDVKYNGFPKEEFAR